MHFKIPCGNEVLKSACIVRIKLLSKMLFKIDFKIISCQQLFLIFLINFILKIYIIGKYKYDF